MVKPPRKKARSKPGPKPALGSPKSASISVRTTSELKEAAERAAAADNRSLNAWIEVAIIEALKGKRK